MLLMKGIEKEARQSAKNNRHRLIGQSHAGCTVARDMSVSEPSVMKQQMWTPPNLLAISTAGPMKKPRTRIYHIVHHKIINIWQTIRPEK